MTNGLDVVCTTLVISGDATTETYMPPVPEFMGPVPPRGQSPCCPGKEKLPSEIRLTAKVFIQYLSECKQLLLCNIVAACATNWRIGHCVLPPDTRVSAKLAPPLSRHRLSSIIPLLSAVGGTQSDLTSTMARQTQTGRHFVRPAKTIQVEDSKLFRI